MIAGCTSPQEITFTILADDLQLILCSLLDYRSCNSPKMWKISVLVIVTLAVSGIHCDDDGEIILTLYIFESRNT